MFSLMGYVACGHGSGNHTNLPLQKFKYYEEWVWTMDVHAMQIAGLQDMILCL